LLIKKRFWTFEGLAEIAEELFNTLDGTAMPFDLTRPPTVSRILNEEMQASDEELETLNEELQATVEELHTTNEEVQARSLELRDLAQTYQAEQARLSAVLLSMGDAVLVVNQDGLPLLCNRAYEQGFGPLDAHFVALGADATPWPPRPRPSRQQAKRLSVRLMYPGSPAISTALLHTVASWHGLCNTDEQERLPVPPVRTSRAGFLCCLTCARPRARRPA
jgi:PAS domain-containing protein